MLWNTDLFLLLNAPARPGAAMLLFAEALAAAPVLLPPILLASLWVWGRQECRPALLAVAAAVFVGQALNLLLGMTWYEPRPFMAGVGHTWLVHVADNGFPSDHATLAWSLGLGLVLTGATWRWGAAACLVGIAAGWARVYLGVHYPVDVLASAPIGLVAGTAARLAVPAARAWLAPPVEQLYEAVIERLPIRLLLPRRTRP